MRGVGQEPNERPGGGGKRRKEQKLATPQHRITPCAVMYGCRKEQLPRRPSSFGVQCRAESAESGHGLEHKNRAGWRVWQPQRLKRLALSCWAAGDGQELDALSQRTGAKTGLDRSLERHPDCHDMSGPSPGHVFWPTGSCRVWAPSVTSHGPWRRGRSMLLGKICPFGGCTASVRAWPGMTDACPCRSRFFRAFTFQDGRGGKAMSSGMRFGDGLDIKPVGLLGCM
jgi:hypothetical protein